MRVLTQVIEMMGSISLTGRFWVCLNPDAIASYTAADGNTYYITANEGDARDYDFFSEEERVKDDEFVLDPTEFPNAADLKEDENLGRKNATTVNGDIDGDGDFDRIFVFGTRSFSIWDAAGNLVHDSGDELEQITAAALPDDFNSNNDENDSFESRSDNKGPEPEGVTTGVINGRTYSFLGLERVGGIVVHDVTDPTTPKFVQYINNRDFSVDVEADLLAAGDLGPEGLVFISAEDSPNGQPLLVVTSEVSGSVSIFGIDIPAKLSGFTLIDAATEAPVEAYDPIADGAEIDLAQLSPSRLLNIRANLSGDVGSVLFRIQKTGESAQFTAENAAPYAVFGDIDGDYKPWRPAAPAAGDEFTLSATVFSEADLGGERLFTESISFSFVESTAPEISSLVLINADTDMEIGELTDGATINLADIGTANLSVMAKTTPGVTGSVAFNLTGPVSHTSVENFIPYALFGDNPGRDFNGVTFEPGSYSLEVTAFGGPNQSGATRGKLIVDFVAISGSGVTVSMYPNPTPGQVTVSSAESLGAGKLVVTDAMGNQISTTSFNGKLNQVLNLTKPGVYFFTISKVDGVETRRVIVR